MRPGTKTPQSTRNARPRRLDSIRDEKIVSMDRLRERRDGRKIDILVIDDDPQDFQIVKTYLRAIRGKRVSFTYADNFDSGLEALRRKAFDVALVDFCIGQFSGLDLIRKAGGHLARTPMILLTGHGDPDIDRAALDIGARDYLDKNGLSADILERAIRYVRAQHDVENRLRNSEESMRAAKRQAEEANESKSGFLARMSHELRTPLNAVIGFADIMANERFGPLGSDKYREYAGDIYESGQHLLDLINDLLDLSKIEAGRYELHERAIDISNAIGATTRLLRERAEAAEIDLSEHVAENLPTVRIDERTFWQVMFNLLSNAIKFTPAGGSVTVTAALDADGGVEVCVADTGVGIDADDLERVLQPFGQVDSLIARKHAGTGLGLPLVKSLVELHGGTLELTSEPGAGTRATVRFPPERVGAD